MLNQIATQVVSDQPDLIIPIATLAAQYAVLAAENTNIPIVYAAISDPEGAGLTGLANVTGVSDALNTPFILDMMFAANPDIQTVGLLYSNSEINSETPIAQAKAYLEERGIAYELRDIKEENPLAEELRLWWKTSGLPLKKFFNTSGLLYKSMNLKERLPGMTEEEQLRLLASDGMLVKRPIIVTDDGKVLTGFKEADWTNLLK